MAVLVVASAAGSGQGVRQTARLVHAACRLGGEVDIALPAADVAQGREDARRLAGIAGVRRVLLMADARLGCWLAEPLAEMLRQVAQEREYTHIVGEAGSAHRDVLGRLAGLLRAPALSDVVEVEDGRTLRRPMFAGGILATVRLKVLPAVLLMRAVAFTPAEAGKGDAEIEELVVPAQLPCPAEVIHRACEEEQHARPDLAQARIVLGMGRGAADEQTRVLVLRLAEKLKAAVAVTRPLVDEGIAPGEWQVGQTGRSIAPDLYMAFGISGAHQHLAGIADAGTIVAINTDAQAPIMQAADLALVMDAREALKELLRQLPQGDDAEQNGGP